ncbi:MAG: glycosyltransferase, partial [Treponema sp.]|nr:glycosyltransferase [Treponema sp.]
MKVAIVHDWLVNYGGAEDVVAAILELYPEADIFTLVYDKKKMGSHFSKNKIYTSHLQKIPFATRIYTKLLNFMPKAFEEFDFSGYDLVICSSSSCAKGVITPPTVPHIAYVHTPMRYAWDLFYDYKKRSGRLTRHFMNKWMPAIRQWDFISSQRIDSICANSNYISRRIKKFWNRESTVIYPPVNTEFYSYNPNVKREDFYVFFSRLVPYKRADIAIQACIKSGKKLSVIGGGSQLKEIKKHAAKNPLVEFTGRISDE